MRNPKFVDVGAEAEAVAGLLSSKAGRLKMDEVNAVVAFYKDSIRPDHMAGSFCCIGDVSRLI